MGGATARPRRAGPARERRPAHRHPRSPLVPDVLSRIRRGRALPRLAGRGGPPCHRPDDAARDVARRSEEHTSELQSLMRISYAVFCLKKKNKTLCNYMNTSHGCNINETQKY